MLTLTSRPGLKGATRAYSRWLARRGGRPPGDDGNLVAVLILVLALAALVTITVAAVIPTNYVSSSSQNGQQAVAQANAGLSNALLQLDQMGDQVSSFCVGDVPSSLLSASGLTSCTNQNVSPPLAGAPGVTYYMADATRSNLPYGVTNEVTITSSARVDGQTRTATEIVYRQSNSFALFGVGTVFFNGKSASTFWSASGNPLSLTGGVTVQVGTGPNGTTTCSGTGSTSVVWIAENGGQIITCSGTNLNETTTLEPVDPSFCGTDQVSLAFAPCIDTGGSSLDSCPSCQTVNGQTYCPLPGSGFKAQPAVTSAPTPPQNAVFDCTSATSGGSVSIGDTSNCSSTSPPPISLMPDGFTTIPPGNYYLDSNNVTICGIPPSALPTGPVNIFIMPQACGSGSTSGQCPFDVPSSPSYTCPVGGSSSPQLTVEGFVNATTPPSNYSGPVIPKISVPKGYSGGTTAEAGSPNDFNLFWGGDSALNWSGNGSSPVVLDSNFYAPGAQVTTQGLGQTLIGSAVVNCMSVSGDPTFYFTSAQHASQYLQGWTVTKYSITP